MPTEVASLYGTLSLRDKDYKDKIKNAQKDMRDTKTKLQDLGSSFASTGAKMTAFSAPVAIGMGLAVAKTREFDRTMSNVFSITQQTGDEAKTLRSELLSIGSGTVAGPQRVAEAYYDIVSGVADASTHMAILNSAVLTSESGQADLRDTTNALISTMNSYGFAADQAAYVSDVFSRTVAMGKLEMQDLATAMPQVTGLAAQFGVGIDEVGASMAYMTAQGFSASQSATFMKSMISTLLNPTADLAKTISDLGYESGQALLEAEGLTGAYEVLKEANGGLAGLITNQEALTGSLLVTKDSAQEFTDTFVQGIDGATEAAGKIQDETEGWDKMTSALDGLAIMAGTVLAPVITDLVTNHITPLLNDLSAWISANPEAASTVAMVAGAAVLAGPVLMGLGAIISGVGTAVGLATTLGGGLVTLLMKVPVVSSLAAGALTMAKTAAAALGTTMLTTVGPILAIGAAIAGVIAQVQEFNRITNAGAQMAHANVGPQLESGAMTQQQLDDLAFQATAAQFGGGIGGDIMARLLAGNIAKGAATGEFHLVDTRASGGPVNMNTPYLVGEQGPELFIPNSSGQIMDNNSTRGAMGGITIQSITINAPGANAREIADGLAPALMDKLRSRGIDMSMGV